MTSHVAYVIYATTTLITTQGLCNITFLPYVFLFYASGTILFLMFLILFLSFISMSPYSLCIEQESCVLSTRNRSTLNVILEGFLKTT